MASKPRTIASKDLKNFLNASKRETRLIGALERHVLSKPFDDRNMSVIHPSDIIKPDWCALAQYHAVLGNYQETREKTGLRLASIFSEGHTIHAKWQKWFQEMGVLHGKFQCDVCGLLMQGTSPYCAQHPSATTYKEVTLVSNKHHIAGHTDGWIKGLGEDCLIEIKSIGAGTLRFEAPAILAQAEGDIEKAWKNIKTPFRAHLLQGQVYLHLCHLMVEEGLLESAPKEIVFIYELKANQDYKEFVVGYNPEFTADIFDKALDVAWAVEHKRPPVCSIDPAAGCKRCQPFQEAK
jgi:hypothetical protein